MLRSKLMKITTLTVCMSMLMALPVFAGSSQGTQNNMNMMTMPNGMQNIQNGMQLSSAAQYMVNQGIIQGSSSGNYSMSSNVKRCDMSLMLVRAFGLDTTASSSANGFSDVNQGSYYYEAVNTIQGLGIAQGDGQNFNPTQNMTLEEAILFVERALDAAGIDYSDVDIEALFEDRDLSEAATREDVSTILYAVLGDDYLEGIPMADSDADDSVADNIIYTTDEETAIAFDQDDFNDACEDATGATLDYIKFTSLSSNATLYYGYEDEDTYDGTVAKSTKYYYTSDEDDDDSISNITLVPDEDYTGTVKLTYTGYNEDGDYFTGTVKVTVE